MERPRHRILDGTKINFSLVCRAFPDPNLSRETYDSILEMLAEGIAARRGRYGAYLHRDRVNRRLRARRGSRLAAITSGGAIPETALFTVVLEPEGAVVGTLYEDFAVESNAGDIMLLGNSSWRIRRVEGKSGRSNCRRCSWRSADCSVLAGRSSRAHGGIVPPMSPTSCGGSSEMLPHTSPVGLSQNQPEVAAAVAWLKEECGLDDSSAEQAIQYVLEGRAVLGTVPTQ